MMQAAPASGQLTDDIISSVTTDFCDVGGQHNAELLQQLLQRVQQHQVGCQHTTCELSWCKE